ncbi:MAG: hypothetical protein CBD43_03165 [Gammaproteobacteria bacterium TMED183]|nr:hypothetical protein [SAR116 cluster bacterium]OUW36927.1 MAG: hypothetical protein CBD43_03165 [Gammaproteobacteria bacterium TMED183]|tara:strand:- start:29 stop:517 length:489 start_codon:yes stop_codon:yes gene_type:complete
MEADLARCKTQSQAQKQAISDIRIKLVEAVRIMKVMPLSERDRPSGVKSRWVSFDNRGDASTKRHQKVQITPQPREIDRMEQCLDRIMALDLSSRRIVLARAAGIPWRRLEEMDGRSHTTLRKVEVSALLKLIAIEGAKTGADRGSDGGSGGGADRDNSQKE